MNNDEIAVTLLDEAISERVEQSGTSTRSIWMAKIVAKDPDGTLYADIVGGEHRVPCQIVQVSADIGDTVEVRFQDGRVYVTANRTDPPAAGSKAVKLEEKVIETRHEVQIVKSEKADVAELNAAKADISELRAGIGEFETVVTEDFQTVNAQIGQLQAADVTITGKLTAAEGDIDTLQANTADIATIRANSAKVQNLTANEISAATGYISDLTSGNVTAQNIIADKAKLAQLDVSQISADHATIAALDSNYAHISNGVIDNATIGYADVNGLSANYAQANMANVNNAWIANGTIKDGAISSAMINDVSANKLTAGTINGSVINVTNLNADNITTGTINGQRIGAGSLSLDKLSDDVYTESEVDAMLDTMQAEIDGAIETWTGTAVPTLNNAPASGWTTAADRDKHVGDVYFDTTSGYNYRFTKSGTGSSATYSWLQIKDTDITNALQRIQTAEGQITQFDSDISTLKTDTGTLKTKTQSLETSLGNKVDTSTFNDLSSTVDENSASIMSMSTVLTNNGLTSSTNITNTVNTVSQTASGNSSKISQLTTTLGTNADGTTKTGDIVHRTSAIEQDVSGFKQTVAETYATKTEAKQTDSDFGKREIITEDAAELPLLTLTAYGECQQDGTPTPDNPVEVQVVGGANLLDLSRYTNRTNNGIEYTHAYNGLEVSGTATAGSFNVTGFAQIGDNPSILYPGTYTLSFDNLGANILVAVYARKVGESSSTPVLNYGASGRHFTIADTMEICVIVLVSSGVTVNGNLKPQINSGITAHPYTPYGCIGLQTGETVTPIDLQGHTLAGGDALKVDSAGRVWIDKGADTTDIGALNWVYESGLQRFKAVVPNMSRVITSGQYAQYIACERLTASPLSITNPTILAANNTIARYTDGQVYAIAHDYTTAAAFKAAMSGVVLWYPLATPQTIDLGYIDPPTTFDGGSVRVIAEIQPVIDASWWTKAGYETGKAYNENKDNTQADLNALEQRVTTNESTITQQADRIGMVVANQDASSSLQLTANAMTYIGNHVEIKDSAGTSTVISGGKVAANSISASELTVGVNDSITNAAQTATNYVTEVGEHGIKIHGRGLQAIDYQAMTPDGSEIFQLTESVAKFGAKTRIGSETGSNQTITASGYSYNQGENSVFAIEPYGDENATVSSTTASATVNANSTSSSLQAGPHLDFYGLTMSEVTDYINSSGMLLGTYKYQAYRVVGSTYVRIPTRFEILRDLGPDDDIDAALAAVDYYASAETAVFEDQADPTHVTGALSYRVSNNTSTAISVVVGVGVDVRPVRTRIGKEYVEGATDNESHMELDYHSLQLMDKEGNTYFHVSDLRDASGIAEITDTFTADGSTQTFALSLRAAITSYTVTVNGSAVTSGVTKGYSSVWFSTAPSSGAEIVVSYVTESSNAKAYTFGIRDDSGSVGAYSVAEGYGTIAGGTYSHAEGSNTTASGVNSHAEGDDTTASGNTSHAEGIHATASGDGSHAEGGSTTASGPTSHAEGGMTAASGIGSHAEGLGSEAIGNASHAEGYGSTASGSTLGPPASSHAEGYSTTASGHYSHSEGNGTTAAGTGSHAEGSSTYASGENSHAQNYRTYASGENSHAQNCETAAMSDNQTALGKYNIPDYNDAYALIVGNGTAYNARSNAAVIDWLGNYIAQGWAGVIQMFAGSTPPNGWLLCDGSAVSRTDYATLYAAIGDTWGAGDGSTTFNLPDLRGRAPIGAGTGSGLTARTLGGTVGAETVKLTAGESGLPAHTHAFSNVLTNPETVARRTVSSGSGATNHLYSSGATSRANTTGAVSGGAKDATTAHNNMQPSAVVNFIIHTGKTS